MMADTDHGLLVDEFCKVTGVESERAKLYLEAAGWNSDLAMSTYYEERDDMDNMDNLPPGDSPDFIQPSPSSSSRFATLSSLVKGAPNDDEEEGQQAFYAGGSERSGQQVLGPVKRKSGSSIAEEMFKAARSHGAELVDPTELHTNKIQLKTFSGKGYVLGSTPEGSSEVGAPESNAQQQQPVFVCLQVYRSGFTVDNGPFRQYTDQDNKEFLESIKRGEVPKELREKSRNAEVHLNIEDHSHVEYVPPKASLQAFSGSGHRLGSPTPTVSVSSSPLECQQNEKEAKEAIKVDETQPVTNLQIRLADGSRLILKLNLEHTVGDIRRYLVTARPEYSASVFSLMTAYPSKELLDDSATVKDENLLNAVIVQKLK